MTSPRFEDPQLFVKKAEELPLTGFALLELMRLVLGRGLPFRFRAHGWSMAPFIKDRDVITIAPYTVKLPRVGDIVAYVRPESEKVVVHRIIGTRKGLSILQGDNGLDVPEELIPAGNILGRVTRIERNGHDIWIGLGPERFMIAWLSRSRLINPLSAWLSAGLSVFSRRNK